MNVWIELVKKLKNILLNKSINDHLLWLVENDYQQIINLSLSYLKTERITISKWEEEISMNILKHFQYVFIWNSINTHLIIFFNFILIKTIE